MALEEEAPGSTAGQFRLSTVGVVTRGLSVWWRGPIYIYMALFGLYALLFVLVRLVVVVAFFGSSAIASYATVGPDPSSLISTVLTDVLSGQVTASTTVYLAVLVVLTVGGIVMLAGAEAATLAFALRDYTSEGRDAGAALSTGLTRLVPVAVVQAIIGLVVAVLMVPSLVFVQATEPATTPTPSDIGPLLYGLSVLIVVSLIVLFFYVRTTVATVVVVAESVSPTQAVQRSFDLTKGSFFHVLGAHLLVSLLLLVLSYVLAMAMAGFLVLLGPIGLVLPNMVSALLLSPIAPVFRVVLYKDLLERTGERESTAADEWW